MDFWSKLAAFLLVGFCLQGRSFAYIGIAPAKIFIGEIALLSFLLIKPKATLIPMWKGLTQSSPLTPLSWCLLLSLFFGIIEVTRGILAGYPPLTAIQNLVFNVYPLYFFLGLWGATRYPALLQKSVRIVAWGCAIYGPAYLLVLHYIKWKMPGSEGVPMFGQAGGGSFVLLGLICLEAKPSKYWPQLLIAAFMLLAMQVRAEWVGFSLALLIWGTLSRKLDRVFLLAGGLVVLLAIGFISDFRLPSTAQRGGEISSREIIARGMAAVNPEFAQEYTDSRNAGFYAGTISWRTRWWHQIWEHSQEDLVTGLIGPGYGYPLKSLVGYLKAMEIRTPHSVFYFCLGYSGWVGVLLFFALQCSIVQLLWRTFKITRQSFGLAIWACTVTVALFGNMFETPFGAIPSYILAGMLIAPGLRGAVRRPLLYTGRPALPPASVRVSLPA